MELESAMKLKYMVRWTFKSGQITIRVLDPLSIFDVTKGEAFPVLLFRVL